MKRGERVIIKIDYDLFGYQIKGKAGIFVRDQKNKKKLFHIPEVGEWVELTSKAYKRIQPGKVSDEDKAFIHLIKKMKKTI